MGLRISHDDLSRCMAASPGLQLLLLRNVSAVLVRSAQLHACDTNHPLRQRLARWLLMAQAATGQDELPVTHRVIARALNVQRPSAR
jgi:CRP-like cAMP-binding protein